MKIENCIIRTKKDAKRILDNMKSYNYAISNAQGVGIPPELSDEKLVYWAGDWRVEITKASKDRYKYFGNNHGDGSEQHDIMDTDRAIDEIYRNRNRLNLHVKNAMERQKVFSN